MYTKARIYTMTSTIQTFLLTPTASYFDAQAQAIRIRDRLRVGRIYQPRILELVK